MFLEEYLKEFEDDFFKELSEKFLKDIRDKSIIKPGKNPEGILGRAGPTCEPHCRAANGVYRF